MCVWGGGASFFFDEILNALVFFPDDCERKTKVYPSCRTSSLLFQSELADVQQCCSVDESYVRITACLFAP